MKNNCPDFSAIIPAQILKNKKLTSTDKLVFGELYSLALKNKDMTCFPSNQHLCRVLGKRERTIKRSVSKLVKSRKINIFIDPRTSERVFHISHICTDLPGCHKWPGGVSKMAPGGVINGPIDNTQYRLAFRYINQNFKNKFRKIVENFSWPK